MAESGRITVRLTDEQIAYVSDVGHGSPSEGVRQIIKDSQNLNSQFWNDVRYIADVLREAHKQQKRE